MAKILVVDDDISILKVIRMRLEAEGFAVTTAPNIRGALESVNGGEFDLALVDLKIADGNGIDLMDSIHKVDPEMPVIILTAYGTIESAVEAMKRGAYSYLTKPFENRDLLLQIRKGLEKATLSREVQQLRSIVRGATRIESIVGDSAPMKRLMELVSRAADTDSNAYLQGESGTGKGIIAKALHEMSSRREKPFVAINCAAIPETLLESELFGFEKGAFTGAVLAKKGLFVQANHGTILLDEISEIPLSMQGKLLKALEEKEFYPLGSQRPVKVDVRIIAASNRDLEAEVNQGKFRSDLFYRIHVIPIKIPPLRERTDDIPLLASHFLKMLSSKMKKDIKSFSAKAMQKMMVYSWPGNVRELENAIECAIVMCSGKVISDDLILPTQSAEAGALKSLKESKKEFEREYLIRLMEISNGNVSQAARLAGKYRADLYDLLERYNLKPLDFRR